jgi:hypothetical protein
VTPCREWLFAPGQQAGWTLDNALALSSPQPAAGLGLTATGGDPFMSTTTTANLASCKVVELDVALSPGSAVTTGQVFFSRSGDGGFAEARSQRFPITGDGARRTLRVDFTNHALWNASLAALRVDPFDASGSLTLFAVRLWPGNGGSTGSSSASSSSAAVSSSSSSSGAGGPGSSSSSSGAPGDWATLSDAQACTRFAAGRVVNDNNAFTAGAMMCDPGTVSRGGLDDTVRRINLYRAMCGQGPVMDDAGLNTTNQACSVLTAWNPAGPSAHFPQPSATCYTPEGASGAGMSNLAWGSGSPANAIDQFMEDFGNFDTFGHRRWILNPSLQPVGIGYYEGGNQYGSAMCLAVFGMGNPGPNPRWYAFPPPGPVPSTIAGWVWTFHSGQLPFSNLTAAVVRVRDGMSMPVEFRNLQGNYGQAAGSVTRMGWDPVAGETYRVTITLADQTTITYDHRIITCN